MADFRKCFYALAVVALLACLTVPASAQAPLTCNTNASVPTIVRAEAYADLVGDLVLSCTGGVPTGAGLVVPSMNVTVFLSTNITSKLVGTTALGFNEALLIVDEPNSPANSNRPILNCGATGAPDNGVSGPGVCAITSDGNPADTYNGALGSATYGSGHPNVFQGRQGIAQNSGQANAVSFLGVPLDPPGTGTTRTFRITNVRADAESIGISSTFAQSQIQMNVAITSTTSLSINNPQQLVAYVQRGLIVVANSTTAANSNIARLNFIQCNSENSKLFAGTTIPVLGASGGINVIGTLGSTNTGFSTTPTVRLAEGFASAWKTKNISFLANGTFGTPTPNDYNYTGGLTYPADQNQNVPGAAYFTESGFEYLSQAANPNPNPPTAIGNVPVTGSSNQGYPFASSTGTGINTAGQATQGTRLAVNFSNIPQGAALFVTPIIYLYRQNSTTIPVPGTYTPTVSTGVAVLTSTDANGNTAFTSAQTTGNVLSQVSSTNLAVYEVLFDDPLSLEQVDIPVVVAYTANLSANPPGGLPVTGTSTQVTAGFAPFYSTAAARLPSATLPVPRFIPGSAPLNLFQIGKCACNLLFPFVSNQLGYDTGIAIANTTTDPGANFGFNSTGPQQGSVTFWYYGAGTNGTAPPATVTSSVVPSGQLLTYVLSTGNSGQGLDNRGAGFQGYIIAQASFQYCHGYAFITSTGALPTSAGVSEGYLGIVLDNGHVTSFLPRTLQAAENDAH